MADNIKIGFEFDDGNLVEGLDRATSTLEKFDKTFQNLASKDPFEEIEKSIQDSDNEMDNHIKTISKLEQQNKQLREENKKTAKSFKDIVGDV